MNNKAYLLILSILILFSAPVFAQDANPGDTAIEAGQETFSIDRDGRAVMATTNKDYPATPGDVYSLDYIESGEVININCIVNSDYSINLGFFGEVDARNKTFAALRTEIRTLVNRAYPNSHPDIKIVSTGIFEVFLKGEVKRSKLVNAWGLTRLADVAGANSTGYTSYRDIEVIDMEGGMKHYDLYKAWYDGDRDNNPLLKPGDVINFVQYEKRVSINGEVKRDGSFQLKSDDNLEDLVKYYANDFTNKAYVARIVLQRAVSDNSESGGETIYIDYNTDSGFALLDRDSITVRSKDVFLPVFFIEGAAGVKETGLSSSNTVAVNFKPGTMLSTVVLDRKGLFSDISDLENSYYFDSENNETKLINIAEMIYEYKLDNDVELKSQDRLLIPFRQLFVTVNGAVVNPGRYPYVPEKDFNYYVTLAGGFDIFRNTGDAVQIYDSEHKRQNKGRIIQQEDVIVAQSNSLTYALKEYSPLIAAVTSIVGLAISLITLTQ